MDLETHQAELKRLSAKHLSKDAANLVLRLARPAIRLRHSTTATRSHLGGEAKLAPDILWPDWNGRPLSFLAVLDLSEIQHLESDLDLPTTGLLNFFYESEEQAAWGFDPAHEEGWRVILSDPETAEGRPAPTDATTFEHIGLMPSQTLTIPVWEETAVSPIHPPWNRRPKRSQRYKADELLRSQFTSFSEIWNAAIDNESVPNHRIGGWPRLQQGPIWEECQFASSGIYVGGPGYRDDPRAAELSAGSDAWRLLFQLDTDEEAGWMWGDLGTLFFAVNSSLFTMNSRPWMTLQCG